MTICELCTDDVKIHIVSRCNHNNICCLCIIKLRLKTANEKCPFCNDVCDKIVLTKTEDKTYEEVDFDHLIEYQGGIYFENEEVKQEVDEFNQIKCPVTKCPDNTVYTGINVLKKHLKEKHNRFFCDICLDHRTLVFREQRLFTSPQLDRHLRKGDLDDEGNVVFFHPYCKFCDQFFYDEEALIKHLRTEHYKCDICGPDRKYFYFNQYKNLEIHYNLSHYLCPDEICSKSHTVFQTAAELDNHTAKFHGDKNALNQKQIKNLNQNLMLSMTNFNYGQIPDYSAKSQAKYSIKDREAIDFELQILSQRKFHTKFHTTKEVSGDEKFDIRKYFPRNQIKQLELDHHGGHHGGHHHHNKEFRDIEFNNDKYGHQEGDSYRGYRDRRGGRGGRGGRGRGGRDDHFEKHVYIAKDQQQQQEKEDPKREIDIEDCNMVNYAALQITREEMINEISKVVDEPTKKNLQGRIADYYKGRVGEAVFFDAWVELLGKPLTYKIFPFFIATCDNETTCKNLDDYFYIKILQLPRKHEALIFDFATYNDFFKTLYSEVEKNIVSRIQKKQIDFKEKHFIMETHRILQLIQIIKRLSNSDMASFKFAMNFGMSPKTKEIINELLLHKKDSVQASLDKISEQEIFVLLKYLEVCKAKLAKTIDLLSMSKMSANLLEPIFASNPDIYLLFEKELGKEDFKKLIEKKYVDADAAKPGQTYTSSDSRSKNQDEERKVEFRPKPNYSAKNIDVKNTMDFPGLAKQPIVEKEPSPEPLPKPLPKQKKAEEPTPQQKVKPKKTAAEIGWQKDANPYGSKKANFEKDVDLIKKVANDFPTLANETPKTEEASFWHKMNQPVKKGTKVFNYKAAEEEPKPVENQIIGYVETKGKNKKGKMTTMLAGGFR